MSIQSCETFTEKITPAPFSSRLHAQLCRGSRIRTALTYNTSRADILRVTCVQRRASCEHVMPSLLCPLEAVLPWPKLQQRTPHARWPHRLGSGSVGTSRNQGIRDNSFPFGKRWVASSWPANPERPSASHSRPPAVAPPRPLPPLRTADSWCGWPATSRCSRDGRRDHTPEPWRRRRGQTCR